MVEVNQNFEINNVISLRANTTQKEFMKMTQELNSFIQNSGAKKNGPSVSVTYSMEKGMDPIADIEIMISLDKKIESNKEFTYKEEFKIENALKVRHTGNPNGLQESFKELNEYMVENKSIPNIPVYVVTVNEIKNQFELDNAIVDIYIGVK